MATTYTWNKYARRTPIGTPLEIHCIYLGNREVY